MEMDQIGSGVDVNITTSELVQGAIDKAYELVQSLKESASHSINHPLETFNGLPIRQKAAVGALASVLAMGLGGTVLNGTFMTVGKFLNWDKQKTVSLFNFDNTNITVESDITLHNRQILELRSLILSNGEIIINSYDSGFSWAGDEGSYLIELEIEKLEIKGLPTNLVVKIKYDNRTNNKSVVTTLKNSKDTKTISNFEAAQILTNSIRKGNSIFATKVVQISKEHFLDCTVSNVRNISTTNGKTFENNRTDVTLTTPTLGEDTIEGQTFVTTYRYDPISNSIVSQEYTDTRGEDEAFAFRLANSCKNNIVLLGNSAPSHSANDREG